MRKWAKGWATAAALVLLKVPALCARECDDSDPCTVNDSCGADGTCHGTFQAGKSCDDFNGCTINDTCKSDPGRGNVCLGDPAPVGTSCGNGCGT